MEFNPNNKIVKLCVQGMNKEEQGNLEEAAKLFLQAWHESENDAEKFIAAYYITKHQENISDRLQWLETSLELALKINDDTVNSTFPFLYSNIATCYEKLKDAENAKKYFEKARSFEYKISDKGPFYHGTKAGLQIGDLLTAGGNSNYQSEIKMNHIYFTALVSGAGLAAALAKGEGKERVYIVEPTGDFENDPNVTNNKFPGNPTRSYRSTSPLKITGEVTDWLRQTPEEIKSWKKKLAANKGKIIN